MNRLKGCFDRSLSLTLPCCIVFFFLQLYYYSLLNWQRAAAGLVILDVGSFLHSETVKTNITDTQFESIKTYVFCFHLGSNGYEFIMSFLLFICLLPLEWSCHILIKTQSILLFNDKKAAIVYRIEVPFSILVSGSEDLFCCLFWWLL